jgi:hypothetical protein
MEIGIDRDSVLGRLSNRRHSAGDEMAETLPLCAEDGEKLSSGNAKRLLKL